MRTTTVQQKRHQRPGPSTLAGLKNVTDLHKKHREWKVSKDKDRLKVLKCVPRDDDDLKSAGKYSIRVIDLCFADDSDLEDFARTCVTSFGNSSKNTLAVLSYISKYVSYGQTSSGLMLLKNTTTRELPICISRRNIQKYTPY